MLFFFTFINPVNHIFRNRVAVQLQKNLDRIRLKRVAAKMKNGCAGGYIISSHPSGMIMCTTNVQNEQGIEEEISYLGTTLFGQKKQKLAKSGKHHLVVVYDVTHLGRRGICQKVTLLHMPI